MKFVYGLFFLVIFLIALLFSLKNLNPVSINLFWGIIHMPLALALTLELLAGVVLGIAVQFAYVVRLKAEYGKLQARLDRAELEIQSLRHAAADKDD